MLYRKLLLCKRIKLWDNPAECFRRIMRADCFLILPVFNEAEQPFIFAAAVKCVSDTPCLLIGSFHQFFCQCKKGFLAFCPDLLLATILIIEHAPFGLFFIIFWFSPGFAFSSVCSLYSKTVIMSLPETGRTAMLTFIPSVAARAEHSASSGRLFSLLRCARKNWPVPFSASLAMATVFTVYFNKHTVSRRAAGDRQ